MHKRIHLAVALINDELALTAKANIHFIQSVKENERVVAKAKVVKIDHETGRTIVEVNSYVNKELVFKGEFEMYRTREIIDNIQFYSLNIR